jgi:hypothetical protein
VWQFTRNNKAPNVQNYSFAFEGGLIPVATVTIAGAITLRGSILAGLLQGKRVNTKGPTIDLTSRIDKEIALWAVGCPELGRRAKKKPVRNLRCELNSNLNHSAPLFM